MEHSVHRAFEIKIEHERVVRGDFYASATQPSKGTLLLCHGYKGFKDWGMFPHVASALNEDVDVVSINLSHNGVGEDLLNFTELDKFARATYSKDVEDVEAVVNFIHSHLSAGEPRKPIFLLGHSRGAGVFLIYALDHPEQVSGVISWNGISDVDLLTEENKAEMRERGRSYTLNGRTKQQMPLDLVILEDMEQNADRYDLIGRVKEAVFPITLIQGTEDSTRWIAGSASLVESNPEIQWFRIAEGNHTFGTVHPYQGATKALQEAIAVTKKTISSWLQ
ncbi:alpha/beta hydrolase family protein [Paenibacillus sp. SI8]|uniref:alpha/beta hydrolase family protein n=1 Tax=unclassified Paenibacillus TaxID=185978 RepID=UPI003465CA34